MTDAASADLGALRKLNELGYLYYRDPSGARNDDLLVRRHAGDALHRYAETIAVSVQAAHAALPPVSREHPFPDPAVMAEIRRLRALRDRIEAIETRLRGAAALPDRDTSTILPSEAARRELVLLDSALLACSEAMPISLPDLEIALTAREAFAARARG